MSITQTRLTEAQTALHELQTGTKAVKVKKDGREVEFTPANIYRLTAYIEELKAQLGQSTRRRRPAGVGL